MTVDMKDGGGAQQLRGADSSQLSSPTDVLPPSADSASALTSAVLSAFDPSPLLPLSSHVSELLQSQESLLASLATARTSYYSSTHTQMLALLPAFASLEEQRTRIEDGSRRLKEVRKRVDSLQLRMRAVQEAVMQSSPAAPLQRPQADVK